MLGKVKNPLKGAHRRNVHNLFDERAAVMASRIAVTIGDTSMTYGELNENADDLAFRLGELGVGLSSRVGICLDRGVDMVVSILGVLKSGAAYVPLDPCYPPERLQFMAADAGLSASIIDSSLKAPWLAETVPCLRVKGEFRPRGAVTKRKAITRDAEIGADSPAYIMYTSGSTGVPKGAVIPHRGITRLVCSPDYVDISADDVFLQLAPISFDASTFEIWGALLNGARLAVMPPGHTSLAEIGEAIRREGVTILWLTGGLFNLMVDERLEDLRPVKQLLVGGEALSVAHVEKAMSVLESTQFINGYGPTENTTFTCCHRIRRGEDLSRGVPIGRAIRGTQVKVVNEQLHEVAPGEEGELLAGGDGVALGYWNRPELTAERFVHDPVSGAAQSLYYRTGDRVRMRDDGVIEFLGRRDGQVKLRGFRIEVGEIESALRKHAGVKDCAVKAIQRAGCHGFLAAYVVRATQTEVGGEELSAHLRSLLPDHMWPGTWVFLQQLPLNPNGKVDRAALPEPADSLTDVAAERPVSDLERIIAETWRGVMGGREPGLEISFFDAGGDSLQVTRLHERLNREHGIALSLTDLFQYPSVRSLATHLSQMQQKTGTPIASGDDTRGAAQRHALARFRKPPMRAT
jgi:amino acid adenylation domain-containing protein